jgi:putative endonuclease
MSNFYVYLLSNVHHTVFYTGCTNDLRRRVYEHKHQVYKGFTKKYNCHKLLYYEEFADVPSALHREQQLKRYKKEWKENLINSINPEWKDLYEDLI